MRKIFTAVVCVVLCSAHAPASARPGPDILYAPLATSPALENSGVWKAPPILISGASAYRQGEFLYQDYLYDDHGANGDGQAAESGPARGAGAIFWGTYTYPTDAAYGGNAADLVEVRTRLLPDALAVRLTYNTLRDPRVVATTIGLGDSSAPLAMPHGAQAMQRAQIFVTVHGDTADAVDAVSGKSVSDAGLPVSVDRPRRQVEVRVPFTVFDPRGRPHLRLTAAAGIWDVKEGRYLVPQGSADASHPGGAGTLGSPPAFFNVAFRYDEPRQTPFPGTTGWGNRQNQWRDYRQASELAKGDLSAFFASVDVTKLAGGVDDDMAGAPGGVPQSGYLNRIMVTHFPAGDGVGDAASLRPGDCQKPCTPTLAGDLVPYALFVPESPPPAAGYAMTLLMHGCSDSHNGFLHFQTADVLAGRSGGSVVATGPGRGPCYWYYGQGGAEIFEMWADVAAHYPLDPTDNAISGFSMGGYATYKFASQFPDLFKAAAPLYGCINAGVARPSQADGEPSAIYFTIPSLRNLPIEPWNGGIDPICTYTGQREVADLLDTLGYRYQATTTSDSHAVLQGNDPLNAELARFFDSGRADPDPPHVTYVLNGDMNEPRFGMNSDHAYWLSGLSLTRADAAPPIGVIDVVSRGFGVGDPQPLPTRHSAGVLDGGVLVPVTAYERQSKAWGSAPRTPQRDQLDVLAQNIRTVTIDPARARVTCGARVNVTSDSPITVTLAGCDRAVTAPGRPASVCSSPRTLKIATRGPRGWSVRRAAIRINGRLVRVARSRRGRSLELVRVRLAGVRAKRLNVKVRLSIRRGGKQRTVIVRRHYRGC